MYTILQYTLNCCQRQVECRTGSSRTLLPTININNIYSSLNHYSYYKLVVYVLMNHNMSDMFPLVLVVIVSLVGAEGKSDICHGECLYLKTDFEN